MRGRLEERIKEALFDEREADTGEAVAEIVRLAGGRQRIFRERIGFGQLLLCQVRFMGWRIWLWEFVLAAAGTPAVRYVLREPYVTAGRAAFFVTCLTVMITMLALPLIYRSMYYGMLEIEAASYFSVKRLLLARILLLFAGETVMVTGLLAETLLYTGPFFKNAFGCVLLSLGLGWSGGLRIIRKAEPGRICRTYLGYGLAVLLAAAGAFKWMPWVFDGTAAGMFGAGGCALIGYCGCEGIWIVKSGGEMAG